MAKKQDCCTKDCKGGKGNVEFGKEICPNTKDAKKKDCK